MFDVNSFDAEEHLGAVVGSHRADAVVEFGAWHGTAGRREGRAGPAHLDVRAEARHAQPMVADAAVEPVAEAEEFQFGDGSRSEPVAARLVPGKLGRVDHQNVAAVAGCPRGGGRTGRTGADHHHVGPFASPGRRAPARRLQLHVPSMLEQ